MVNSLFFIGEAVENVLDDILDGNPGDDDLNTEEDHSLTKTLSSEYSNRVV